MSAAMTSATMGMDLHALGESAFQALSRNVRNQGLADVQASGEATGFRAPDWGPLGWIALGAAGIAVVSVLRSDRVLAASRAFSKIIMTPAYGRGAA